MVFGKPVVAYASGGLREILEAVGSGAYLVPTRDSAGLAEKCAELLSSMELTRSVGERNRGQVEAVFGPAAYDLRLQGLVQRIQGLSGLVVPLPEPAPIMPSPDAADLRVSDSEGLPIGQTTPPMSVKPAGRRRRIKLKRAKRSRRRRIGAGRSLTARRGGTGRVRKPAHRRRKPGQRTARARTKRVRGRHKSARR
ncbi:hypothetical protein D3C81_1633460 [compost metagenome]